MSCSSSYSSSSSSSSSSYSDYSSSSSYYSSSSSSSSTVSNLITVDIGGTLIDRTFEPGNSNSCSHSSSESRKCHQYKVFEVDTQVPVTVKYVGDCWNPTSTITLSASGGQLFWKDACGAYMDITDGNTFIFAELFGADLTETPDTSHVIYGGDPATMKDYQEAEEDARTMYQKPIEPLSDSEICEVWWNTLRLNYERQSHTNHKMKVVVDKTGATFKVEIWRSTNGNTYEKSCEYNTSAFVNNEPPKPPKDATPAERRPREIYERMYFTTLENIFLQTHWHSGVKFTGGTLLSIQ